MRAYRAWDSLPVATMCEVVQKKYHRDEDGRGGADDFEEARRMSVESRNSAGSGVECWLRIYGSVINGM